MFNITVMKMHRLILLISMIYSLAPISISGAEKASEIIDKAAAKFSGAPSISASYTMTSAEGTSSGTVVFAGQKFHMTAPGLLIWYDGTTQWTYLSAENEVNISEPTADDLQQINPFAIISTFRRGYNAKLVKSDKSTKVVSLTAQSKKSEIQIATVTVGASDYLPIKIELKLNSGRKVSIAISGVKIGKALPVKVFQFPSAKYPKAEIIDLR